MNPLRAEPGHVSLLRGARHVSLLRAGSSPHSSAHLRQRRWRAERELASSCSHREYGTQRSTAPRASWRARPAGCAPLCRARRTTWAATGRHAVDRAESVDPRQVRHAACWQGSTATATLGVGFAERVAADGAVHADVPHATRHERQQRCSSRRATPRARPRASGWRQDDGARHAATGSRGPPARRSSGCTALRGEDWPPREISPAWRRRRANGLPDAPKSAAREHTRFMAGERGDARPRP